MNKTGPYRDSILDEMNTRISNLELFRETRRECSGDHISPYVRENSDNIFKMKGKYSSYLFALFVFIIISIAGMRHENSSLNERINILEHQVNVMGQCKVIDGYKIASSRKN